MRTVVLFTHGIPIHCNIQHATYNDKQSANKFTGTIPDGKDGDDTEVTDGAWSNLAKLSVLMLNDNQLSGTLPFSLFETSGSTFVKYVFSICIWSKTWPTAFLHSRILHCNSLDLGNNAFTGSFPQNLGMLSNLKRFHAQLNRFTGTLPVSMNRMSPILDLNLTGNL